MYFQVASTGVRNTGTLAGNLMIKHNHQYFPSDCFLMLETLGANVVVANAAENGKEYKYSLTEWLKISMKKKIVKKFTLPALSKSHVYKTFKITPRQVHAHAYVNAGFLVSNHFPYVENKIKFVIHWPTFQLKRTKFVIHWPT